MKHIIPFFAVLAFILCVQPAHAILQDCTITWTPNSEADLAGYKVYVAPTAQGYTKGSPALTVPKTQTVARCHALNLPSPSTYFFAVTAFDTSGNESAFSNEMSRTIADEQVVPKAYVTRVQTDADGATVTISGHASKLYVASDRVPLQDVVGYTPGSATHRYVRRWSVGDSYVCFIAENVAGEKTEQGCNAVVIAPDVDLVAPAAPTLLEVK